ncbi:hypothetical protein [Ectopseudomonas khazarica]|uniref:hypothetical protein n=1 Tax=Ectopseudomonas khazarica TaxID=2502979 RepID=UPI0037C6DC92
MRWLSDLAGSLRTSFGIGRATISSASLTAARTVTLPDRSIAIGDPWEFVPIGVPFGLWSHLAGVDIPPNDNPNYRYIKLTASDSYNDGVLTSESISGSAPHVQATAVISDAGSPLNGQTVQLVNTGRWLLRPGQSGVVELDQGQLHKHRTAGHGGTSAGAAPSWALLDGVDTEVTATATYSSVISGVRVLTGPPVFSASGGGTPRMGDATRDKSIGADYYMRIR